MGEFWRTAQDAVVGLTFSWIVWVLFTTLRRYLIAKAKAGLQEKILQRIDSSQSLVALASSDSGRQFLESMTVEEVHRESPFSRILFGMQAGIVLVFFGGAMLLLHHHVDDPTSGFIIVGTGAIGLGLGFFIAAAASFVVSRQLGLMDRERRG